MGSPWVFAALVDLDYGHPSTNGTSMPYWRGKGQGGIGFAWDRWLLLGKAGVVGQRATTNNLLGTPAGIGSYGWTAGAELNWAFTDHFIWKVIDYQFVDLNGLAVGPISLNTTSNEVKTGLTYRWNGPGGAMTP